MHQLQTSYMLDPLFIEQVRSSRTTQNLGRSFIYLNQITQIYDHRNARTCYCSIYFRPGVVLPFLWMTCSLNDALEWQFFTQPHASHHQNSCIWVGDSYQTSQCYWEGDHPTQKFTTSINNPANPNRSNKHQQTSKKQTFHPPKPTQTHNQTVNLEILGHHSFQHAMY